MLVVQWTDFLFEADLLKHLFQLQNFESKSGILNVSYNMGRFEELDKTEL